MALFKQIRQNRYMSLISAWFTPREARMLSVLPKKTPALKRMVEDRLSRRNRFEKIAAYKISYDQWRRQDVPDKWIKNLSRLYTKRGWRVKTGGVGKQPKMAKHSPNPWAAYRSYERLVGGTGTKNYVSPWELRNIKTGKTPLDKGLVFIQKQSLKGGTVSGVPKPMIEEWIRKKDVAIKKARGEHRKSLIEQRDRLRKSL